VRRYALQDAQAAVRFIRQIVIWVRRLDLSECLDDGRERDRVADRFYVAGTCGSF